jgi:hypothetical protein
MTRFTTALAVTLALVATPALAAGKWVTLLDKKTDFSANWDKADLPPLKWSSLKYVLNMEDWINGEEEAYG